MNRSKRFDKRTHSPEPIHESVTMHRLICRIMKHGDKNKVAKAVYAAVAKLAADTNKSPKEAFDACIHKITPSFSVRTKKIASSNYRIPVLIHPARGTTIAIGWLTKAIRESKKRGLAEKIHGELAGIYKEDKNNSTLKIKDGLVKMAEKNKAFLHYL